MGKVTPIDSPQVRKKLARSTGSQLQSQQRWQKATDAYQLLVGGKLPSEIADLLQTTTDEVQQLLDMRFAYDSSYLTGQQRETILGLELIRLEALLAAVWPSAMLGDPKSVDSAIKIVQTKAKITGLEQVDPVVNKNLVLVMGEREEDYIASLRSTRE